jgi:ubiquitin-like protein ATG12
VEVLLKAAGDAPIMKKKKWTVEGTKTIAYLIEFIKKYIRCEPEDSLVS